MKLQKTRSCMAKILREFTPQGKHFASFSQCLIGKEVIILEQLELIDPALRRRAALE